MFDSLKLVKIDDDINDNFYEDTSGFFDPKKISTYMQIENNSYIEYMDGEEVITEYLDGEEISNYTNTIKIKLDMTKEHRLHWQLLASMLIIIIYYIMKNLMKLNYFLVLIFP